MPRTPNRPAPRPTLHGNHLAGASERRPAPHLSNPTDDQSVHGWRECLPTLALVTDSESHLRASDQSVRDAGSGLSPTPSTPGISPGLSAVSPSIAQFARQIRNPWDSLPVRACVGDKPRRLSLGTGCSHQSGGRAGRSLPNAGRCPRGTERMPNWLARLPCIGELRERLRPILLLGQPGSVRLSRRWQ